MLKEFKAFALRGNVLDLAVGIIIGGAFGTIVKSLVDDVIMPPIGLALGNVDFANLFLLFKPGAKASPPYARSITCASAVWATRSLPVRCIIMIGAVVPLTVLNGSLRVCALSNFLVHDPLK